MNNFLKRTITGIIFVAVLIGAVLLHPLASATLFGTLAVLCYLELASFFREKALRPDKTGGIILGMTVYVVILLFSRGMIEAQWMLLLLPASLIIAAIFLITGNNRAVEKTTHTLTGTFYVFVPFALTNLLLNPGIEPDGFHPEILLGILVIIWANDVFAYLGGSIYGKHKLTGSISPHKTLEGTITGVLVSILTGFLISHYWEIPYYHGLMLGFLISLFGVMGDLSESVIKRSFDIKDSGRLLPGHGGLLDRFDAFLFSVPVATIYLTFTAG